MILSIPLHHAAREGFTPDHDFGGSTDLLAGSRITREFLKNHPERGGMERAAGLLQDSIVELELDPGNTKQRGKVADALQKVGFEALHLWQMFKNEENQDESVSRATAANERCHLLFRTASLAEAGREILQEGGRTVPGELRSTQQILPWLIQVERDLSRRAQ